MKKLALVAFAAALSMPVFAAQDKPAQKDQPKMAEACKDGCKMADKDCPEKCMKACADRAEKAKKADPKHPA